MNSNDKTLELELHILDKDYVVGCAPDEEAFLREAAQLLDSKMREIRSKGKIVGIERIAVMAALNIAYDLLQDKHLEVDSKSLWNNRIRMLSEKIASALDTGDRQLSL